MTRRWAKLFTLIQKRGFYRDNVVADSVVILFVFMPLLRKEVYEFLQDKNDYPTRRQTDQPGHIPGPPNKLYEQESDHGFTVHTETLQDWEANVALFSEVYSSPPFTERTADKDKTLMFT